MMLKKSETAEKVKMLIKIGRATKDKQFASKTLCVRLVYEGHSILETAHIVGCCEKTVYNNLLNFRT